MSWLSENKFLAGFATVMLVGVGGVGWFTMSANAKYAGAKSSYDTTLTELSDLQGQKIYPNQANQKAVEGQKAQVTEAIGVLQKQLATTGFPIKDMSASDFQNELKRTLDATTQKAAKAGKNGVKLPPQFNLGFNYLDHFPDEAAAKPLGHQLKAVDWVVDQIIKYEASEIKEIVRNEIQEEKKQQPKSEDQNSPKPTKESKKDQRKLVTREHFTITFVAAQTKAREAINGIVACKEQFLIPRRISIENEKKESPKIADATQPKEPGKENEKEAMTYVLGEEKIVVTMEIEVVDFVQPSAPAK